MKILKEEIEGKCKKYIFQIEGDYPYLVCAESLDEVGYYWGKYDTKTLAEAEERFSSSCKMWG